MIKLEKGIWIYILVLFIVSYLLQAFVILNGGESYKLFTVIIGFMMFLPSIGAIIYLIKTKNRITYIDWKIGKPIYILLSLIIPTLITVFGIILFENLGWGINNSYSLNGWEVKNIDLPLLFGNNQQSFSFFILNILITGIGFSILTSLMTIGEEIGWRGFLQKKLLEKNSLLKSLIFLGLIWGFWHFPLITNGFNYPEYPIWGAFLIFPLSTVFISFFMGWLTLNSKSIWPAVLAHGGINSIMTLLFEMDFGENKFKANFLILGIWIIIGIIAYMLIYDRNKKNGTNKV